VLVGARTAGCVNGGRDFALLDGSGVRVAEHRFLIGPHRQELEGIGAQPDVVVDASREDLAAGRDPALAAAERVLLDHPAIAARAHG
jgi:C-terminal processing protease CtpA/Prc